MGVFELILYWLHFVILKDTDTVCTSDECDQLFTIGPKYLEYVPVFSCSQMIFCKY